LPAVEGPHDKRTGGRKPAGPAPDASRRAPGAEPATAAGTPPPSAAGAPRQSPPVLTPAPSRRDLGIPSSAAPIIRRSRAAIGIDLGTTHACAALVRDGRPVLIPSREGHPTIPAVVALSPRGRLVAGHAAKAQLLADPAAAFSGAKRLVGLPFESEVAQAIRARSPHRIVADASGLAAVQLGPATLSMEQVTALVLGEVKAAAQDHLGEEVNRAVVTVPAFYDERQRAAVRSAGALAGIHVERLLNEPTAAALAHAFGRHLTQRLLVYDLGGGTFDASLVDLADNVYEVVSTGGDLFLGGADFDALVLGRLLAAWEERTGAPFAGDRVALSRLADAAERAKCALSERSQVRVTLPFLAVEDGRPLALEAVVTRDELAAWVEPLVDGTLAICREVIGAKGLRLEDVHEVLLVGGQSRMPLVEEKVAAFFGRPPARALHGDEAVAIGAALLADALGSAPTSSQGRAEAH
jgi:molecular chaperone DnaK